MQQAADKQCQDSVPVHPQCHLPSALLHDNLDPNISPSFAKVSSTSTRRHGSCNLQFRGFKVVLPRSSITDALPLAAWTLWDLTAAVRSRPIAARKTQRHHLQKTLVQVSLSKRSPSRAPTLLHSEQQVHTAPKDRVQGSPVHVSSIRSEAAGVFLARSPASLDAGNGPAPLLLQQSANIA